MGAQLQEDRALAMLTLRPRQNPAPPYSHLTDSGRAEVDRVVALIGYVRATARRQAVEELTVLAGSLGELAPHA